MENGVFTVEVLKDVNDLRMLENAFLSAVGEEMMAEEAWMRLEAAIKEAKIIFFVAKTENEAVGMCSVSPCFSTFACKPCGVFDDFFVKPEYRKQGIARKLIQAAQTWCKANDCASLIVGCSREDVAMYQSLGFDIELGIMLANNL